VIPQDAQLLVVDDDPGLRDLLSHYLTREGFKVATASDGRAMDRWLEKHHPDLIILDLMLPGEDGLSLARRVRATSDVPIIMISARGDEVDRILGLELGADDYLPKPFNPRELLARVRAVLRRRQPGSESPKTAHQVSFGPFTLDLKSRQLTRDGEPVALTSGEFDLLEIFAAHPDQVLHRDRLLDLLKGYERTPFDRSIDVQIARLRSKIEDNSKEPRYILTVWGKGYRFSPGPPEP
jgi:two-component system phosphate regulon response regulator OmpR